MSRRLTWTIRGADDVHVVEITRPGRLSDVPGHVLSAGVEYPLGPSWRKRRHVTFEVAGRPATMSITAVRLGFLKQFLRGLGWQRRGGFLRSVGGYLLGGAGLAGGFAGAAAADSLFAMLRFELSVDGVSRGTWVATLEGGAVTRWQFFEAGAELPDPNRSA